MVKVNLKPLNSVTSVVPRVFAGILVVCGIVLMMSGTGSFYNTTQWIRKFIPLSVFETSELLCSIVGLLLLFLARGVQLRVNVAWVSSLVILGVGVISFLIRDFRWLEASILGAIFISLLLAKPHFYRKSSLLTVPLSPAWFAIITMAIVATVWLGFFTHEKVQYSSDLWWQFSYDNSASRFLRSIFLFGIVLICLSIMRLMSVGRHYEVTCATADDLAEALPIVQNAAEAQAYLALLGDKTIFWSTDRKAFLAYKPSQEFWFVMGDPIGDPASFKDLIWQFKEAADLYACKPVFYEITPEHLPLYLDMGLALLKIGQYAQIPLKDFSLTGKRRTFLRTSLNKFGRLNYRFEVIEGEAVSQNMPRLKEISDAWLAHKKTHEKAFSLGYFDEAYLLTTPIAIVRDDQGKIMAFANLWCSHNKTEFCPDLMRYAPDSPTTIMDYLFTQTILYAQAQGYTYFSLGMAPLSGLERHRLAPFWHKIGSLFVQLGDNFYNFDGLYHFKDKFNPEWQPRYIACPQGLTAPYVLLRIAAVISKGWRGLF